MMRDGILLIYFSTLAIAKYRRHNEERYGWSCVFLPEKHTGVVDFFFPRPSLNKHVCSLRFRKSINFKASNIMNFLRDSGTTT